MSFAPLAAHSPDRIPETPVIECGIIGPHQQQGFLLRASRVETLVWDLDDEIASTRRVWLEDRSVWWIAASYLEPVIRIVLRSFPSVLVMHDRDDDRLYSRDGVTMSQQRLL
jgi:hypothetical protein